MVFDTYARIISRHPSKSIYGNPNVSVNNMLAVTITSASYTFNQAPTRGTLINSFDRSIVPSQRYGSPAFGFDVTKLNYIGAPDAFKYIMAVTKKPGISEDFISVASRL